MATTLGSLILELGLNDVKFKEQLASVKKLATQAGKDIEGNLKGITSETKLETLKPTVDESALGALNLHIEKKREHVMEVNAWFNENPLTPKTNVKEFSNFKNQFDGITDKKVKITTETSSSEISDEDSYLPSRSLLRLDNSLQELHLQNKGLTIANENLANSISALSMSVKQNIKSQDDMPIKMSKIIHTSSKETLVDKIVGLPARAFETFITGAVEGMGQTLSYDFAKGAQRYIEGKTGVDAETVGYNFGRYGYNRSRGLAMITAEAFGYRGGLKEVGDDIAYLGKKLDSFIDPKKITARIKSFEDLIVASLEDIYTYGQPERSRERVTEYFKPEVGDLKEGLARAGGVGLRAMSTPFRIRKRANLATSMELSKMLSEDMEVPDIENIDEKEVIALVTGGVDLQEGGTNTFFARNILKNVFGESVATIPVPNVYSNSEKFGPSQKLRDIFANLAADITGDESIRSAGEAIPIDRLINIATEAGFNPDAIVMDAVRRAYEKKYGTDKKFIYAGTSAGTITAEEATAIAERGGSKNIKGFGATLPMVGLTNTASNENFRAFVGNLDPMLIALLGKRYTDEKTLKPAQLKLLEASLGMFPAPIQALIKEGWTSGLMAPSKNTEIIQGAGQAHHLGKFMANEEVQKKLSQFLGMSLTEEYKGKSGETTFKSYADMFGEFESVVRTLRALEGDLTAIEQIRKFEQTEGKEGGYAFVRSDDLSLRRSSGPMQEKFDLEYALENFQKGGSKAPSKFVEGAARKEAELFQNILMDMVTILKEVSVDMAGQKDNLIRTLGVLSGQESSIRDVESGQYAFVTPEGKLKKSFGESQEKYDIEYAIEEFDTKGDIKLEKVKSLMQSILDATKNVDKADVDIITQLSADLQDMLNDVGEISLSRVQELIDRLNSIFGDTPKFDQIKYQDIEDLAQGKKTFDQLRKEYEGSGRKFSLSEPQPIESKPSNLPTRKHPTQYKEPNKIVSSSPVLIPTAESVNINDTIDEFRKLAEISKTAAEGVSTLSEAVTNLGDITQNVTKGVQPAATQFIEQARERMTAIKTTISGLRENITSQTADPTILPKIQYLMGSETAQDPGYINQFISEIDNAISQLDPTERMRPIEGTQLANLKGQGVKAKKTIQELQRILNRIDMEYNNFLQYMEENVDIIQNDFTAFTSQAMEPLQQSGEEQIAQLTAANPPPDYLKLLDRIRSDFINLARKVKKGSPEEQQSAAKEILLFADSIKESINAIQTSSNDEKIKSKGATTKGQITKAVNIAETISLEEVGQAIPEGLVKGMRDRLATLIREAEKIGVVVDETIKRSLGIQSPSKVTEYIGRMVIEGLVKGINNSSTNIDEKLIKIKDDFAALGKSIYSMADMYQINLRKSFDMSVIKNELTILRDSINEALTLAGQLEDTSEAVQNTKTAIGRIINYPNETIVAKYKEDVRSNARRVLTEPPDPDIHPAAREIPADAKKIVFVSSGFTGTKGKISNEITDKLKPMAPQGTHMIPFENKNFDVSGTLNDVGLTRVVMDAIIMPMKAVRKGINEEALRLAKQAYAVKQERPDVEIGFVGHSAGGFIVREAQEILKNIGIISEALSMGTPLLGAFQAIKSDVISLIGEGDPLKRFTGQKEAIIPNVKGHFSPHYLDESNEIREILTRYLEEGITPSLIARVHELGETIKGLEPGNSGPVMRFDRLRQSQSYQQAYLLKTHTNTIDVKAEEVKNNKIQPLWSVDRNTKDSFDEDMSNGVIRNIGEIIDTLDDITPKARKVFEELVTEIAALSDVEVKEMPTAKNASMQLLGTRAGGAYSPEYNTIFLDDETEEALEALHDIKGLDIPISLKVIEDEVREVYKRLNNNTSDDLSNDYNDELDLAYETVNKKYSNITEDIISLFEAMNTIVHEIRHAAQVGFQKINDPYSRNLLLTPSYNRESDREYARNIAGSVELAKRSAKEQGIDINPHYINKLERDAYGFSHQYTRDIIRSYQRYNNTKTENILPASKNIGSELGSGIAIGINDSSKEATNAAMNMAEAVIDITHSTFEIKSPPEWAIKIGRFISEGISNGISDGINYVRESIKNLKTKTVNDIKEWARTPPEESFMPFSVSGERPEAEIPVIGPAYAFILDSMESMKINFAKYFEIFEKKIGFNHLDINYK